jgi:hypothetical protein
MHRGLPDPAHRPSCAFCLLVVKTLWWLMSIFAEFARRTVESEISKDLRSKKHEIHAVDLSRRTWLGRTDRS